MISGRLLKLLLKFLHFRRNQGFRKISPFAYSTLFDNQNFNITNPQFSHEKINKLLSTKIKRFSSPCKMSSEDEFEFVYPICEDDYEKVIEHLKCNFFAHEVMNKAVGITEVGDGHPLLEEHSFKTLKHNLSVMALDICSNKVAAVCLNGVLKRGDLEAELKELEDVEDEKYKLIFECIINFNLSCNIFEREGVGRLFECRILSVDEDYRGKGLGCKLVEISEDIARKNGFSVMKTDVTGAFSQKIFRQLGHKVIFEKKYADIRGCDGERLFKTEPPHEYFQTTIKRLDF